MTGGLKIPIGCRNTPRSRLRGNDRVGDVDGCNGCTRAQWCSLTSGSIVQVVPANRHDTVGVVDRDFADRTGGPHSPSRDRRSLAHQKRTEPELTMASPTTPYPYVGVGRSGAAPPPGDAIHDRRLGHRDRGQPAAAPVAIGTRGADAVLGSRHRWHRYRAATARSRSRCH